MGEEAEFTLAEESLEDVDKGHTPGGLLDLESNANDFAPRGHPIVNWYGLRQFIILSTKQPIKGVIQFWLEMFLQVFWYHLPE